MRFDSSRHATGVAGVAPFVAALVPWTISASSSEFSRSVVVRFVFGAVEVALGPTSADVATTAVVVTRTGRRSAGTASRAVDLWLAAAAVLALALVVGAGLLLVGERLTRGAFDPVRLVGVLCLAAALLLSGSAWLFAQRTPGVPVPAGVAALYLFGAGLLTIDRTRTNRQATETSG